MKKIYSLVLLGLLASVTSTAFALDSSDDERNVFDPQTPCNSRVTLPGSQLTVDESDDEDGVPASPTKNPGTNPFANDLTDRFAASTIGDNDLKQSSMGGLPAPVSDDEDNSGDEGDLERQQSASGANNTDSVLKIDDHQEPDLYQICKSDEVANALSKFLGELFASGSAPASWDLATFAEKFKDLDGAEQLLLIDDSYGTYGLNRSETPYETLENPNALNLGSTLGNFGDSQLPGAADDDQEHVSGDDATDDEHNEEQDGDNGRQTPNKTSKIDEID